VANEFATASRPAGGDGQYLTPIVPQKGVQMTTAVHQRLRDAILNLELEPGERISQLELTRQLDVSRTPLREALRLLEREALIEPSTPHGLVVIQPLSVDDLLDLYSLRVVGDSLALWLTVPQLDKEALRQLSADLRLIDKGQPAEVRQAHRRFHEGLRAGSGERLRLELGKLFEHAERYQLAALSVRRRRGRAQSEHRAILRAAKAGDRELAAERLMEHCAATAYELMAAEAPGRSTAQLDAAVAMARSGLRDLAKDPEATDADEAVAVAVA
jgi:DNA-binding GntR family transcriptional regulator